MSQKYKGTVTLNGKKYKVERINDVVFVDGRPIDIFIDDIASSDTQALIDLAKLGKDITEGRKIKSPQNEVNKYFQKRNN